MDSATETEGGGREGQRKGGGRGICCHGERFFKQLLIRLCCSAPLFHSSPLPLSLSLSPAVQTRDLYATRSAVDVPAPELLRSPPHAGMGDPVFQTQREDTSR